VPARLLIMWAGEWVVQNCIRGERDQLMLLPVDMREWLPEDDIVWTGSSRSAYKPAPSRRSSAPSRDPWPSWSDLGPRALETSQHS
jgi:hypothetical protein